MNIEDVTVDWNQYQDRDLVEVLFEKQDELRKLYNVPICDLDIPSDQQQLRAMAWNVIEEAAEAIEAKHHPSHLLDELADMTAFYIELLLMSGMRREHLYHFTDFILPGEVLTNDETFSAFAVNLAISINTLKNRYWRKTNVKTDQSVYLIRLSETAHSFMRFVQSFDITFTQLMDAYLRKHEVNLFRIRSKY